MLFLCSEGWRVSHSRVLRTWRREGLKVPYKQPKRSRLWLNDGSCIRLSPRHRNHVWSWDFVFDRTRDGRTLKLMVVMDEFTRRCLAIHVARRIRSKEALEVFADLMAEHGVPEHIRSDYGPEMLAENMPFDPYMSSVGPGFAATFNDYYRRDLGVEMDRQYVMSAGLYAEWDYSHKDPANDHRSPAADTGIDLAHALIRNPDMRVLVQQGYFDLATPYRATEYFIDQMPLPEPLRANVEIKYYQAGHMMYVHPPSLADFKRDLAAFLAP